MDPRYWIRNFFGFTRNQTNGFIFLLPLITLFIFSEPIFRWWKASRPRDFSAEQAKLDSLAALWNTAEMNVLPGEDELPVTLFSFDPNKVTEEELLALGFSTGLTKRLINYRKQGGRFAIKSDLLKLYGMDSTFFRKLESYVLLPAEIKKTEKSVKPMYAVENRTIERKPDVKFNLNLADTAVLKSIYGIGEKRSLRIVTFREALGGFISLNQLYEVYGLDSMVVDNLSKATFIPDDFYPRTIKLNRANEAELSGHPYISKRMARALLTYRFQHGKFHSVDDLKKILQLDENTLQKLKPYLSFD